MKNYNVVFQNGHFWDSDTHKRLIPMPGAKFALLSEDGNFLSEDPLNKPHEDIRSSETMKALVLSEPLLFQYCMLLPAGALLYFRLGLGRKDAPEERMEYVFEVELLEDLYLYHKSDWASATKPSCFDCACIVRQEINHHLRYFEPVYATSLNHAFESTSMLYYARKRSSSVNVFNEFRVGAYDGTRLGDVRGGAKFVKV